MHVDEIPLGYGIGTDIQEFGRDRIGCWEYRFWAAYTSEFAQILPEGATVRIENIESLLWVEWEREIETRRHTLSK